MERFIGRWPESVGSYSTMFLPIVQGVQPWLRRDTLYTDLPCDCNQALCIVLYGLCSRRDKEYCRRRYVRGAATRGDFKNLYRKRSTCSFGSPQEVSVCAGRSLGSHPPRTHIQLIHSLIVATTRPHSSYFHY